MNICKVLMNTGSVMAFAGLLAMLSPIGTAMPVFAQEVITLRTVVPIDVPVIEDRTLKLKVDLVFDHCPEEYWLHYNKSAGRLVLEFFGIHVDAPQVRIKGSSVISDLKVVNSETMFALNGKNSQVSMLIKKGAWHYDSRIIADKVLRIQLWMPLNPSLTLESEKKRPVVPVVLLVAAVVGVATTILLSQFGPR